jgi:hypothetical protein
MALRGGQCEAQAKGRIPFETIVAEQDKLLARRTHLISGAS